MSERIAEDIESKEYRKQLEIARKKWLEENPCLSVFVELKDNESEKKDKENEVKVA